MSRAKVSQETVDAARAALLEVLHDGDTVYTVLRSVSRSGMSRRIDLFQINIREKNQMPYMAFLTHNAAILLGLSVKSEGLRIDGCGMDMGYHLVHNLAQALGIKLIQRWL